MYEHLVNKDNLGPRRPASGSNVHYEEWFFLIISDLHHTHLSCDLFEDKIKNVSRVLVYDVLAGSLMGWNASCDSHVAQE